MKHSKNKLALKAIVFSLIFFLPVFQSQAEEKKTQEAIILADVGIYNAKINSQDKNQLTISFRLDNGKQAQPDIIYAVSLKQKNAQGGSTVVDEKVYSEIINLAENQSIEKVISYTAPDYLAGNFEVWVISENSSGLPLGMAKAGEIKLSGTNQFINIQPETCFLTIKGDSAKKKYLPNQGVDIKKEETLIATCDMQNTFNATQTVTPFFETYFRSMFGEKVNEETQTAITLNSNEKRTVDLILPKEEKPQAYDVALVLKNNAGKVISNRVVFHYVLYGASATIQNIRLDKNQYKKGETANLTFNWTASADSFPESRLGGSQFSDLIVVVSINDSRGNACTRPTEKALKETDQMKNMAINIPITSDCSDPNGTARIKTADGKILDEQGFQLGEKNAVSPQEIIQDKPIQDKPKEKNGLNWRSIIIGMVLISTVFSLALIFLKKDLIKFLGMILFFLLTSFFAFPARTEAVTFTVPGGYEGGDGPYADHYHTGATYLATLDKKIYEPGEEATLYGEAISLSTCDNGYWDYAEMTGLIDNNDSDWVRIFRYIRSLDGTEGSTSGSLSRAVKTAPGDYEAVVIGYPAVSTVDPVTVFLPYKVVAPCVDSDWEPDPKPEDICDGETQTQLDSCDDPHLVVGTKQPEYEYICDYSSTGLSCANNCGKDIISEKASCLKLSTNRCGNIESSTLCSNCSDKKIHCPSCGSWQEVSPK
ncbi:MAG: hypothetical protein COZ85_03780 [Candidatus Moranbacteria bacterium CG_4_8_14_3_um_filter_34_16]|nr:MAG: hypothetical protein COZ85_03780 [Candidatus Moranbacteria bacterium CG_4_8_14_3_um_filter_34_16]